jgi:hypothetical protein
MNTSPLDLLLTIGVLSFLIFFMLLWIQNEDQMPLKQAIIKKYKALIRTTKTRVPTLCAKHACEILITKGKGRMAVLDGANCELCNKKARLV